MTAKIRFHLDENVDSAIADGLRRRNVEVTTSSDVGMIGASDEAHLEYAVREQRVIFTHDADQRVTPVGQPAIDARSG